MTLQLPGDELVDLEAGMDVKVFRSLLSRMVHGYNHFLSLLMLQNEENLKKQISRRFQGFSTPPSPHISCMGMCGVEMYGFFLAV